MLPLEELKDAELELVKKWQESKRIHDSSVVLSTVEIGEVNKEEEEEEKEDPMLVSVRVEKEVVEQGEEDLVKSESIDPMVKRESELDAISEKYELVSEVEESESEQQLESARGVRDD